MSKNTNVTGPVPKNKYGIFMAVKVDKEADAFESAHRQTRQQTRQQS